MTDEPNQQPRAVRVSKAPEPIRPIVTKGFTLPDLPPIPVPNWNKWGHMRDIELWEAVAVSVNFEPDELPVYLGAYEKYGDDPFKICPAKFLERLLIANSNCGITFGFKPVHTLKARCLVDLPDFAAWALKLNIPDMPPELVKMATTRLRAAPITAPESPAPAHQTPDGIACERYKPLEILIEPFIHLSLNELPDAVRKRVDKAGFLSSFWDSRPDQRRPLAQKYDIEHDRALEPENEYWFELTCKIGDCKREIEMWSLMQPQSISEAVQKETKLIELNAKMAALHLKYSAPYAAPAQSPTRPAPVEADKAGPLPLTTGDIAFCFAGLRCKTEEEWKILIGKGRDWVEKCLVQPGTRGRGGAPKLWNPVCIGAALVRDGHANSNSVRAKFQTVHLLKPWLETWKTYEADNLDTE